MLFNSITFVLFHLLFVALYWATKSIRVRQVLLLLSSVVFYGWYYWPALILLGVSMVVNYGFSRWIEVATEKKKVLTLAVVVNLCSLSWFKYSKFIADNVVAVLGQLGLELESPPMNDWLPLGISFYTFQIIGYLVDVSRGQVKAERNFLVFGVFKCFYAQLVAGPIVRAKDLIPQLKERHVFYSRDFQLGLYYLLAGLAIKVCIADTLAQFVNHGFGDPGALDTGTAWLTLYGFAFQILSDFWGYSTVAIGLGLMYGIELPLNFNLPYLASSIRDFWRRWHITLSEWLRDYVYIPLGGNRRWQNRNLFLTMLLGGLWHGASWNFVFWGAGHGMWLALERVSPTIFPKNRFFKWLKIFLVFNGVCLLWVFFRAGEEELRAAIAGNDNVNGLQVSLDYFRALFMPPFQQAGSPPETLMFILLGFLAFMFFLGKSLTDRRFLDWSMTRQVMLCVLLLFLIIAYADAQLDFIYFVF
ncbi:MBOAT family protein [Verrucomicrobiales bacterium]|nr:MBOAT family protein [Verrucomicrobiales bacterium]MDC0259403.1 MBOAT family protein [Verrucomicrobiales bacterium]MDC0311596.1 MBOAT family protein [bacterium]